MSVNVEEGGHGATLVGVPAGLLGSAVFNDYPQPLHIAGVREQHHELFERLAAAPDPARAFDDYMEAAFKLSNRDDPPNVIRPRRFRADCREGGAAWGVENIPSYWLKKLDKHVTREVTEQTEALLHLARNRKGGT